MNTAGMETGDVLIDERVLSKLKWRCRRGLLENDIFIERFFKRFESTLTVKQAQGLNVLMDLSDSDLLDLHLGRKTLAQLDASLVQDEVCEVLSMLKKPPERSL
ncbi:succinate dehydrogenase assembly factor 2 [Rhodoferax sp.]|uniref:FAD assembly factor SdhE n=1 Tax=Rhodoferax sp. TaxID=50421 RepID=UPI0026243700|nr:succinate dehydrogenase assembly factor 2 [Rhodoferax sp.]MDD3936375.1 succinate dehydrogenase assembly factor 2 [Rhodoferax sp.]